MIRDSHSTVIVHWTAGQQIDPAPVPWFILKFISVAQIIPSLLLHNFIMLNHGLKYHPFNFLITWIPWIYTQHHKIKQDITFSTIYYQQWCTSHATFSRKEEHGTFSSIFEAQTNKVEVNLLRGVFEGKSSVLYPITSHSGIVVYSLKESWDGVMVSCRLFAPLFVPW